MANDKAPIIVFVPTGEHRCVEPREWFCERDVILPWICDEPTLTEFDIYTRHEIPAHWETLLELQKLILAKPLTTKSGE